MNENIVHTDGDVVFHKGRWYQAVKENKGITWIVIPITDVWEELLLKTYEDLVIQLHEHEYDYYNLKEMYLQREHEIIETTDFKEIYGKNNEKIRNTHVKGVLSELVHEMKTTELNINFMKNYIPLLREVIHYKRE